MMKSIISLLKNRRRQFIFICLLIVVSALSLSTTITKAEDEWAIGGSGKITNTTQPKTFGADYFVYPKSTIFLLNPITLTSMLPADGQKKIIEEFKNTIPAYGNNTVAIIPYDFGEYLDQHSWIKLSVIKRATDIDPRTQYITSKSDDMKAVLKMEENVAKVDTNGKESPIPAEVTNGVYYNELVKLDAKGKLGSGWESLIGKNSTIKDPNKKCEIVWSYITRFDSYHNVFHVSERINNYLHIKELKIDPNKIGEIDPDTNKELFLRYTDFLMTVYTQIQGSSAANIWKTTINEYINNITYNGKRGGNIAISTGFAGTGLIEIDGNEKRVYFISGCQDFIDTAFRIDPGYTLTNRESADKVAKSLIQKGKDTTYYNRLLESLRLSVVKQVKNKEKVDRTFGDKYGVWSSGIISRMILNKPVINGTSVSWKSGEWGEENYIENIYLLSKYYGTNLVPAYPVYSPRVEAKAVLKVDSTIAPGQNPVEIKDRNVLNDEPELSVYLDGRKDEKIWDMMLKPKPSSTKVNCKVQVKFTRKPASPGIDIYTKDYVSKAKTIDADTLLTQLKSGKISISEWVDKSLLQVVIKDGQALKFTYQAEVTIFYSTTTTNTEKMNPVVVKTNEASISYKKAKIPPTPTPTGHYISTPTAYSELKEGSIYNETFEAMAGVPTTRTLYFASGGSEFMVELEVEYDENEKAARTYRSYFAGTDCEFKKGDTAPDMTLGETTASMHGGGTYSKTWTGDIPNNAKPVPGLHDATCPADPIYTAYDAALSAAQTFVTTVNSTKLSFQSASDDKIRTYSSWGAYISTNSQTLPQTTTAHENCSYKAPTPPDEDGNGGDPGVPCGNEIATATPGPAGSFIITVTWTVPAHCICGPCCTHTLPAVEDTWTQNMTFDTLKIIDVRVWKIESSYVNGMEEITYSQDNTVKATIKQGDPNIFYNIAASNTSQAGRLRYSLQQQQHDAVTWYEYNSAGEEKRTNKCDGMSGTLCSTNQVPVAPNQGHSNSWATGILYSNTGYTNDVDHQAKATGVKTGYSGAGSDSVDKQTEEYNRFTTRRNLENKATVISDMLILQTSSGDQAAIYFETSQTKKSQENYTDINVTFNQMWTSNNLSASGWSKDEINIGSYNGEYYNTSSKYKGSGDGAKIATAFDKDSEKVNSGDAELKQARVVSSKSFVAGSGNKSTPSSGQYRMARPTALRLFIDNIKQNPINPNGEYFPDQSYVYYKNILSYTSPSATGMADFHGSELTTNDLGDYGYTIKSSYKVSDGREGNVNSIVVHNPVSVEDAMIVSLPSEMDQRTTLPAGSAQSLLEEISASEVCPLSPGLCEFRVHNCKYGTDIVISSFNFEQVSTKALKDPISGTEAPIPAGSDPAVDPVVEDSNVLVLENFTSDYAIYDIISSGCTVSNSLERLVAEVTDKNSYIDLAVNADTTDIAAVKVSFDTSGKSARSYLNYSPEKNGTYRGNVEKAILPETANQTVEFNVGNQSSWRELGTVKRLRINLDGDNTGGGTYIIKKIELIPNGQGTEEAAVFTGSEDDTSIIRSLIVPSSGQSMDYRLTGNFAIDKNNIFGTGRSLSVSGNGGTRLTIPLAGIGISYQRSTNLKIEANINIPASSSFDNMLFSFNGLGFYIPKGSSYGYFITSDGAVRRADIVIVGSKLKLGAVFSFGSINECKLYVNNKLVTSYTTISNGAGAGNITEEMIGTNLNIGSWTNNDLYSSNFMVDNLTVTRMAGSTTHTAACYVTFRDHSYAKEYTCDQTQEFNYTGSVQVFTAPEDGTYKLEAWGAQGGNNYSNSDKAGKGGYASGEIYLKKGQTLQVFVGAQGVNGSNANYTGGAFNGGGAGMDEGLTAGGHQGGQGGGATDFRISDGNVIAGLDPDIGEFANITYSGNVSKVTLDTGESAVKIAKGSTHTAATLTNVFKAGHNYQISFEAWSTAASDIIYADAFPDSLPDMVFNITNSRKVYTAVLSSPLPELEGAAFRLFASSSVLNGDVYITNIKVCDASLSATTSTYTIGTGLNDTGSLTYGPYVNMPGGTYQVDIYGNNLMSCSVNAVSRAGATSYTITNINKTNTHITYYVNITEDIIKGAGQGGLEIRISHSGITGYSVTKQTISRLEDRVLVAGGGGGTGCASKLSPAGDGGGLVGGTTWNSEPTYYLGYQASGGTQTSGGTGMRNNAPLTGIYTRSGGFGYGADASQCGAGGGGGWYGGGSSYTGGGGGGSSYIGGVNNGTTLTGVRRGEGYARITNLTHKHTDECSYTSSENNTHVHNNSCINSNSMALVNALMSAENGDYTSIKSLLGDTVFNKLKLNPQLIYTWDNWSPIDFKQFRALYHTKLSTSGDNLVVTNTGTDPYFDVPVNLIASSVNKVRIYARLVGVTSPYSYLFFTNDIYPYYTGKALSLDYINADNNWQWIEFDLSDNPSWTGKISNLRFDIVGNDAGTGYVEIDQIQLVGNPGGGSTGGTATKVLCEYSGFSSSKRFGITDDYSPASTTFANNCVVNSGNLDGWDFILPVSINNADALTAVRITLSNRTNSTSLGVSTDRGTEYYAGMAANDGGAYQTIIIDTAGMSGSISNLYFDIAAGAANGATYVSKIELIGYGNVTSAPTDSYTAGTYDAHIHTQNCIYTPGSYNYTPVTLTDYHNSFNGGFTNSDWNIYTTAAGSPQRLYSGTNTIGMTSSIGPNRYVNIAMSAGCLTCNQDYSNFFLKINGSWMTVNNAVSAGFIKNASVTSLYGDNGYTPHPYPQNLFNGTSTGTCVWQGLKVELYTSSTCTIQDIQVYASYTTRPGDGITIRSGALVTSSGTWSCGNLPLNTYSDLVTTVTPVEKLGASGSQTLNYTGGAQYYTAPITGKYTLEVWGAQGGNVVTTGGGYWYHDYGCTYEGSTHQTTTSSYCSYCGHSCGYLVSFNSSGSTTLGGTGGYSTGNTYINQGSQFLINVGGQGSAGNSGIAYGGYNGGGYGYYQAGGGGGGTDIKLYGGSSYNLLIAAGGGGGAQYYNNYSAIGGTGGGNNGGNGISSGYWTTGYVNYGGSQTSGGTTSTGWNGAGSFGQGGNAYTSYIGGGGGGYYGGAAGAYYGYSGAGGSGYTGSLMNASMTNGVRSGNGIAKITWYSVSYTGPTYSAPPSRQNYTYTPAVISYAAPSVVTSAVSYGFGGLNGDQTGIDATIAMIANLYNSIPYNINGSVNPIWGCNLEYNTHVCDQFCKDVTTLVCNEPHHFGVCYDYDNEICWDACGNDSNHKNAEVTEVKTADGDTIHVGTFICLDNYFQVFFPNIGDFYGNGAYGIENTTMYRGKGYLDNMSTLEWLREKRVRFGFDVLFNRNGVWEEHRAGEWITLPIRNNSGNELSYYDFYCILANNEKIAASVEFQAEAINCISSPGGKENPYLGDNYPNADCPTYSASGYMTNKERFTSKWAFHSAFKQSYTDVVGRIGNFIIEDTEDFRYSNFFKQTSEDKWIVEGIIREVNADISKNYLSWFRNDGSYGKDIRGVTVSKATNMYDTYGTQSWTNTADSAPLPLQGAVNNVASLKDCQLKLGYNVLFDISTIGDYHNNLQVVPYFYALNLDTNTVTPVDVYISMDNEYKPINYFGLMSDYVDSNNNNTAEYYTLKDKLYDYILNLDWDNEARRRNYTNLEEAHTKLLGENMLEPVTDASGTVLTYRYLTIPSGNYYSLGTLQMLLPGLRARTFIGSSNVNTVNINGSTETNLNGVFSEKLFWYNAQRWHMTLGAPSSAIFVPYRNKKHILPTDEVIGTDGKEIMAYEEIKNGNYVILMTADIKAIGNTYVLGFDQGVNNGVLRIKGKMYSFGEDMPNVFAVYDAEGSAVVDIDFTGTH